MILEDFVMLGTTVPEPNSDGRVFVCSAGVSAEYGDLVRLYPLARRNIPHRWGKYRVPVERNRKDPRPASFKVAGPEDRTPGMHEHINEKFELVTNRVKDADRIRLLAPYQVGSIEQANARRLSLAVIQPSAMELDFEHNPASPDSPQLALFDDGREKPSGARRFPYIPRIRFKDELRWNHLMLRDWGCYELMRKHPERRTEMAAFLHLTSSSSLLIGNINNQRTAWLIISVLNHIREAPTLFDALPDDRPRISEKLRRQVYDRDEWKCVRCGSPDKLTVDHKWPHSRGGNISLANLQTLCNDCNLAKSDLVCGGL